MQQSKEVLHMLNSGRLDKYNLGRVKTLGKRKVAALRAKHSGVTKTQRVISPD